MDLTLRRGTVTTDLPSLVQTICDDFADAGRNLKFNGPSHLEIDCDPEQLTRAITNLIDNALKYGHLVSLRILSSANDQFATIEVEDDGPGIPDSEKRYVFEPFYRNDAARTFNETDSFGLGLSIAQTIVRAHGGELELSDAQPHGLVARIRLPRQRGRSQVTGLSLHILPQPLVDEAGDLQIVLLQHHHVTVAEDAAVLQPDVLGLHAGLVEIFRRAVVVDLMIRGLGGDDDRRNALEIDELVRRRLLHPARE